MTPVVVEPADMVPVVPPPVMSPSDVVVGVVGIVVGVVGAVAATDVVPPSERPPAIGTDTGAGGADTTGAGGGADGVVVPPGALAPAGAAGAGGAAAAPPWVPGKAGTPAADGLAWSSGPVVFVVPPPGAAGAEPPAAGAGMLMTVP